MDLQHISQVFPDLVGFIEKTAREAARDELAKVREEVPTEVVGYKAAENILRRFGTSNKPINARTIGNYVRDGRIPFKSRTRSGRNIKVVFSVSDLIQWDQQGRPNAAEYLSKKV